MADFEGNPFADPEGINPFAVSSVHYYYYLMSVQCVIDRKTSPDGHVIKSSFNIGFHQLTSNEFH